MHSFRTYRETNALEQINERFSGPNVDKAIALIVQYLEKRLGTLYPMPGVEHFKNSHGEGYGLRYFTADGKSFRLNWKQSKGSAQDIVSVDVWNGTSHDPNVEITVAGASLMKILPSLADVILRPQKGEITVVAENVKITGKLLLEASNAPEDVLDEMIELFTSGVKFSTHKINTTWRTTGMSLWRRINKVHPDFFDVEVSGARQFITIVDGITAESFDRAEILAAVATMSVGSGGSGETYTSPEMKRLEAEARAANAIPYEEQLEDLQKLVKALTKGASNALFVGGAGGTGKTHTVEKALADMGLADGQGYFKNTTSASASGMYKTLYDFRNSIVLFDDCDTVFKDQESRNLLKAATDTKSPRKLSWSKNASWLYKGDPAKLELDPDDDEFDEKDDEDRLYPKYFEFRGKIIFISNLQLDQIDPDGALRTRGFVMAINPTNEELLNFMKKIMNSVKLEDGLQLDGETRQKVFDVIAGGHNKEDVNMRKLVRGMNMAAAGIPGWESLVARYA